MNPRYSFCKNSENLNQDLNLYPRTIPKYRQKRDLRRKSRDICHYVCHDTMSCEFREFFTRHFNWKELFGRECWKADAPWVVHLLKPALHHTLKGAMRYEVLHGRDIQLEAPGQNMETSVFSVRLWSSNFHLVLNEPHRVGFTVSFATTSTLFD